MSTEPTRSEKSETPQGTAPKPVLHRVCVTCNNMFRVAPENYEAKQCPNCHKGG